MNILHLLAKLLSWLYGQDARVARYGPWASEIADESRPEIASSHIVLPGIGHEVACPLRRRIEFVGALPVVLTGGGR